MLDFLKNLIYDFKPSLRLFESRIQHSSDPWITIVMTKQNVSHDCDDQEKRTYARTMTHYRLNDCTNLSNIIDIMNSLTGTSAGGTGWGWDVGDLGSWVRLPWLAHNEAPGPYITIPQYRFNKTKQHTLTGKSRSRPRKK